MGSPVSDQKTNQKGSAFTPVTVSKGTWQICYILYVDSKTYTCTVRTEDGRLIAGLPWPGLELSGSGTGGTVRVPRIGQAYALSGELNAEYLAYIVPTPVDGVSPPGEHRVFHGGEAVGGVDPLSGNKSPYPNYRGALPPDVLPGDWVQVGSQGNMCGVLEGGTVLLKAAEMAKVVASPAGDLLHLVGRNTDIMTDFGEVSFRNDDGRVSMKLRGGSQQTNQTSPEEEKFTIHADLGSTGDLVDFRVTNTSGNTLGQVHYTPDGAVETRNAGEVNLVTGSSYKLVLESQSLEVKGDCTTDVTGVTSETHGMQTVTAAGGIYLNSGNDASLQGANDVTLGAGRILTITASGSVTPPADAAMKTVVTNGSWMVDIGNPLAGDALGPLSGFDLKSAGDIQMATSMGSVSLLSPTSITLGQQAVYKIAKAEAVTRAFNALYQALLAHTHSTPAGGPTGTALSTAQTPLPSDPTVQTFHAAVAEIASTLAGLER